MRRRLLDNWEIILRKKLKKANLEWDKEQIWQQIEQELPVQDRRKPVLFFWLMLGFLILGGSSYWVAEYRNLEKKKAYKPILLKPKFDPINSSFDRPIEEPLVQIIPTQTSEIRTQKQTAKSVDSVSDYWPSLLQVSPASIISKTPIEPLAKTPVFSATKEIIIPLLPQLKPRLQGDEQPLKKLSHVITPLGKLKSSWSIEHFIGISKPISRSISSQNQHLDSAVLGQLDHLEKPLESMQAGFLINYTFHENWSLKTGVEWQQITERLTWENSTIKPISVLSDSAYFKYGVGGELIYLPGELQGNETTIRSVIHYNRYHSIGIPILLAYQLQHKRWRVETQFGGLINLNYNSNGKTLDHSNPLEVVDFMNDQSNIGWSVLGEIGLHFALTNKHNVGLMMGYRYQHMTLKGLFDSNQKLVRKYQYLGGRLQWQTRF